MSKEFSFDAYLLFASGVCAVFKESTYILCHTEGDKSLVCQGITLKNIFLFYFFFKNYCLFLF